MKFGNLEIRIEEKSGNIQLLYKTKEILSKLSPVLFCDEEWLSESSGQIKFQSLSMETKKNFENNAAFPEFVDLAKIYTVTTSKGNCKLVLHLYGLIDVQTFYLTTDLEGNDAESDRIGGFIECGIPQKITAYHFFHGMHKDEPTDSKVAPAARLGMSLFIPGQSAWQEPRYSNHLPDNEALSITYLLGRIEAGPDCIAFVPVNRFGQISTIRSGAFLEFPQGVKFVSGDFMSHSQYTHLAGGLISFGEDPLVLSTKIFAVYMRLLRRPQVLRISKPYPTPYEYIGFCTWNTFYASVDMEGVKALAEENFTAQKGSDRFKYLIIDDGWQSINGMTKIGDEQKEPKKTGRGLRTFEPNRKFPNGLREIADLVKGQFGIKWLGVWHATFGYWDGVEPNSPYMKEYPIVTPKRNGIPDPKNHRGYDFWIGYYRYLRGEGIDLLKIDNQCAMGHELDGYLPLDDAVTNHYENQQGAAYSQNLQILNCMCMPNYCYINWRISNISRVSDDFGPGNYNGLKHQLKQCAFNPLFYGQFCWPDHDMLQTKPGQNGCPTWPLILMHMVSGGPIYVADEVGETDGSVVNRMTFSDGRIPRLDMVAMPTIDSLFTDTDLDAPLKIWSYHDLAGWGRIYYYFIGNMINEKKSLIARLSMADFGFNQKAPSEVSSGFNEWAKEYVLKDTESIFTQELKSPIATADIPLENLQAKYFQISPLIQNIAILGIKEVFNGTKAILKVDWLSPTIIFIDNAYPGTLQIYKSSSAGIKATSLEGQVIEPKISPENPHLIDLPFEHSILIEITKMPKETKPKAKK